MPPSIIEVLVVFVIISLIFTFILSKIPQRIVGDFAERIRTGRKKAGLTLNQLAALTKSTEEELQLIESGEKRPDNNLSRALEKHLDIIILRFNTFYLITLIKKRNIAFFDKFKHHERALNAITDFGLLLGFGAIAADYMWGRKLGGIKRIGLFVIVSTALYLVFNNLLLGILSNPFIAEYNSWLAGAFAIAGFSGFIVLSMFAYGIFIIKSLLMGEAVCPGIAPLIPGVEIPNVPIVLPLHAWISFLIILVVHEGMHAILARKNNYTVKSAGLLLLGFLPIGAFVEPDEQQVAKGSEREAVRIYSAGPAGNIMSVLVLSLLVIAFLVLIFFPFIAPWQNDILGNAITGFTVSDVSETIEFCGKTYPGPSFGVLTAGSTILAINGSTIKPGEPINITQNEPQEITVDENGTEKTYIITPTETGQLGFSFEAVRNEDYTVPQEFVWFQIVRNFLASFIFWLIVLNFLVAIVNFLPIEPFDGGKIAKVILVPYFGFLNLGKEKTRKWLGKILLWIILLVMAINALPLFL